VVAIVAQRLVRRICPVCSVKGDSIELHVPWTGEVKRIEEPPKAVGCDECSKTGYKGRVGLYEMIVITDEMRRMIVKSTNAQDLVDEARKGGYRTLFEDGLDKVAEGMTSLEEVMRVTRTVLDEDIYSSDLYSSAKNQIQ